MIPPITREGFAAVLDLKARAEALCEALRRCEAAMWTLLQAAELRRPQNPREHHEFVEAQQLAARLLAAEPQRQRTASSR